MSLRDSLSMYWLTIQGNLFPWIGKGDWTTDRKTTATGDSETHMIAQWKG